MGVPLFDHDQITEGWGKQRRHIACIQDVEGLELYAVTGTMNKGGVVLQVYWCGRGSTSLESFHAHLKNFIPGMTANDKNFQVYLLEGIVHWNEDRVSASVQGQKVGGLRTNNTKRRFAAYDFDFNMV